MGSLRTRMEYDLGDANRVCPGIHKVIVRRAIRNVVQKSLGHNSKPANKGNGGIYFSIKVFASKQWTQNSRMLD